MAAAVLASQRHTHNGAAVGFRNKFGSVFTHKDGRYVFVVPWQRAVMIGTTDTGYDGDNMIIRWQM